MVSVNKVATNPVIDLEQHPEKSTTQGQSSAHEEVMAKCDALVVGGGPIGLLTALLLKEKDPDKEILILEKREEYIRKHSVRIKKSSYKHILKSFKKNNEIKELVKSLSGSVPIAEFEEKCADLAKQKGITILKGEEYEVGGSNGKTLAEMVHEYGPKVVIATDGKKSACLTEIDGAINENNRVEYKNFQTLLKVDFKVSEAWKKAYDQILDSSFIGCQAAMDIKFERKILGMKFSKEADEDGKYGFRVFFQLSAEEKEYLKSLEGAEGFVKEKDGKLQRFGGFTNPITLEHCQSWVDDLEEETPVTRLAKEALPIFTYKEDDPLYESITHFKGVTLPITSYKLFDFAKKISHSADLEEQSQVSGEEKAVWTLFAGDSAGGVPYERSINGGILTVDKLVKTALAVIDEKDVEKEIKRFNKFSKQVWDSEILFAKVKKVFLIIMDFFSRINGKIVRAFPALKAPYKKNPLFIAPANGLGGSKLLYT